MTGFEPRDRRKAITKPLKPSQTLGPYIATALAGGSTRPCGRWIPIIQEKIA